MKHKIRIIEEGRMSNDFMNQITGGQEHCPLKTSEKDCAHVYHTCPINYMNCADTGPQFQSCGKDYEWIIVGGGGNF